MIKMITEMETSNKRALSYGREENDGKLSKVIKDGQELKGVDCIEYEIGSQSQEMNRYEPRMLVCAGARQQAFRQKW